MVSERALWLAWSRIPGIGPILLKRLQQHFQTLEAAWEASPHELGAVEGIGPQTLEVMVAARAKIYPEQLLETHERENPCFWTPADPGYPHLLLEIPDPPPVLYYKGQVQSQEQQATTPAIAIVGTRDPSEYGRRWARKLSSSLAHQSFTVVSGLAYGIDTEAHQSCLDVGGYTIAVLGTGVDMVYPWKNQKLYDQIAEQGLLVSEYPAGTQPDRSHFPRRNRIIAGLSRAILVMEAPGKSGALITAHLANDYGRDVYVLPGSLDNPRSMGCLKLLSVGAQAILSEIHLLEMLGTMPRLQVVEPAPQNSQAASSNPSHALIPDLAPELRTVLQALTAEPTTFDVIVQQVGLAAAAVSSALLQLELLGLVSQAPGMRYQLS
ncbi:MAG: DNA-processing protein DprA [Trichocoleus desertorum ATA4-8-CV12]|nr:DNA-processing protein DprA [Trichocoleus desertorum ATA4-8-CV12]